MSGPHQMLLASGGVPPTSTDPSFASVVQLAHFDGTNGSTTLTNSCSRGTTLIAAGGATISTAQSVFGGASFRVPSTSPSNNGAAAAEHADYDWGTSDFTIELRIRFDAISLTNFLDLRGATSFGGVMYTYADGKIAYFANGSERIASATGVIVANTWYAFAVCRVSGTTRLFVDGVQKGSNFTDSINYSGAPHQRINLGNENSASVPYPGYYDELRLTNGVGRYSANYTPATAAFPNS